MAKFERTDRVSEEIRRDLDSIIRENVRDPRVDCMFSLVRAEVTRDLRWCTVYVSVLEPEKRAGMMKALESAAGFLRRELGRKISTHYTPELVFKLDTNIEYAAYVDTILKKDQAEHPYSEPAEGEENA